MFTPVLHRDRSTRGAHAPRARARAAALFVAALAACAPAAAPPGVAACPPASAAAPGASALAPAGSAASGATGSPAASGAPRAPRVLRAATVARFEPGLAEAGFLPRGDPAELGVDGAALDALVKEAEATRSDSLIVVRSGKVIVERYFGHRRAPLETMSITKSLSSLAVGLLLAEGKIASVDAPLSTWFPEWREGKKARVTLRHVMTQTSGVQRKPGIRALNAQGDRLAYARRLAVEDEPGASFFYSNEATQLLAGVVEIAARMPLDTYLQRRLLDPMGIRDLVWSHDRAGKPQAYFGAALHARDLARIGLLMLHEGQHEGKQLLPAEFVRQATSPGIAASPQYGLLWWIRRDSPWHVTQQAQLDQLKEQGFAAIERLRPLVGQRFAGPEAWWSEAGARLDAADREDLARIARHGVLPFGTEPGRQIGYYSDGSRGQKLGITPALGLVAVRQHHSEAGDEDGQKTGFASFHSLVEALVVDGQAPLFAASAAAPPPGERPEASPAPGP